MLKKLFLGALAGLMTAAGAQAASITYTLVKDVDATGAASPGSFVVFGTTSADTFGFAAFQFGTSGITDINNDAPAAAYNRSTAPKQRIAGFTLNLNNSAASTSGGLNTTKYDTDITNNVASTNYVVDLVYGFGRSGGDLSTRTQNGGFVYSAADANTLNPAYGASLLLADGHYDTTLNLPLLTYGNGNVFTSQVPVGTKTAGTILTINTATLVNPTVGVPEPASLATLGVVGLGLMTRRRKAA